MTEKHIVELKMCIGDSFWSKNDRVNCGFLRGQIVLQDYNEVVTFDVIDDKWVAIVMPPHVDSDLPFVMQSVFRGDGDTPTEAYNDLLDTVLEFAQDLGVPSTAERMDALRKQNDLLKSILSGILPCPIQDAMVDAALHVSRTDGVSSPFDWGRIVGRNMIIANQRK